MISRKIQTFRNIQYFLNATQIKLFKNVYFFNFFSKHIESANVGGKCEISEIKNNLNLEKVKVKFQKC